MIQDMLNSIIEHMHECGVNDNQVYIYAHNAGKFDLKVMLKALYLVHKAQREILPIHISDPNHDIYQIVIQFGGKHFCFRDSMKLLLSSVANLNERMLGGAFPKLPMNLDLLDSLVLEGRMEEKSYSLTEGLFEKDSRIVVMTRHDHLLGKYESPHAYLKDYCVIDCEIVAKALVNLAISFKNAVNYPLPIKDAITISSLAMKVFISKFNNRSEPIMSMSLTSAVSTFIRKAYMGGRVEVFNSAIGLDKVYHFDVPGMYALCMTKDLPIGNPVFISALDITVDSNALISNLHANKLIGFFECEVTCPADLNIPVLGTHSTSGKLYFPTGTFKGT